jgi:hypothetical protein
MSAPSFVPALLATGVKNGWITPSLAAKASALVELGLHPEQALLGTGLLSVDQYGELLSGMMELPFQRVAPRQASFLADPNRFAVVTLAGNEGLVFGFFDPTDRAARAAAERTAEQEGVPFLGKAVLWSDVRPSSSSRRSAGSMWRSLRVAADRAQAFHLRLQPALRRVDALHGFHLSAPRLDQYSTAAFPALRARLLRRSESHGWRLDASPLGLTLVRHEDADGAHPTGWTQAWSAFRAHPEGVLLLVDPDPFAAQALVSNWPQVQGVPSRRETDAVSWTDARTDEGKEWVLQAALRDEPVVAISDSAAWLTPVTSAGVPVRVLEATHTSRGTAWSAYAV